MKRIKYYHHVCNGGPTLSVSLCENREDMDKTLSKLEISEGYEAISNTTWSFYNPTSLMLRKWADVLIEAAIEIEKQTPEQFE